MNKEVDLQELFINTQKLKSHFHKSIFDLAKSYDISTQDLLILFTIYHERASRVSELAQMFSMHQANVSTQCKKLEQEGYLIRTQNETDVRMYDFSLTDQAQEFMTNLKEEMRKRLINKGKNLDFKLMLDGVQEMLKLFEEE